MLRVASHNPISFLWLFFSCVFISRLSLCFFLTFTLTIVSEQQLLIPLFHLRNADSFPPLSSLHLFQCFLSWSQFPFSAHSPMVCARWCWHINTCTYLPYIASRDLPRNTLVFLRTLRSLSLCPTIEWTLHNPTSTDSWPVVLKTSRTFDRTNYPLYETLDWLLVDSLEPSNHTRAMTDLTTGQL